MGRIYCLFHKDYTGEQAPHLSCKTCCHIYISKIKSEQTEKVVNRFDTYKWVAEKSQNQALVENQFNKK
jgi:hypothetical protein